MTTSEGTNGDNRHRAMAVIADASRQPRDQVLHAIYVLKHHACRGDEAFFYPLLDNEDDGVVAAALDTLVLTFDQMPRLAALIKTLAMGDNRDRWDMPIQTKAINLLGHIATTDEECFQLLRTIAEDRTMAEVPRFRALFQLAKLSGNTLSRDEGDELVTNPDGARSQQIRTRILNSWGRK